MRSSSVSVTVIQPPVVSLSANPNVIAPGMSSTLSWSATNLGGPGGGSCVASANPSYSNWSGTRAGSGSQPVSPTDTVDFSLTCTNPAGSGSDSERVAVFDFVVDAQPTTTVNQLESATNQIVLNLITTSTALVSLSASGFPANVTSSFSPVSCSPTCNSVLTISATLASPIGSYTITVIGTPPGAAFTRSDTFLLTILPPRPRVTITANPPVVTIIGASTTLNWTTQYATSCDASASPVDSEWTGSRAFSGSQSVRVENTPTTFTLTCVGPGGSGSGSVTVRSTVIEEIGP